MTCHTAYAADNTSNTFEVTEMETMINKFSSTGCKTHLLRQGTETLMTLCGRRVTGEWDPKIGKLDMQFACKACLAREEAPCTLDTVQGQVANHKMVLPGQNASILLCTKCPATSKF